MPLPARVHMRGRLGRLGGRGLVLVRLPLMRLGQRLRNESGARNGARPYGSALEKRTPCFIVLAHADFLLMAFWIA